MNIMAVLNKGSKVRVCPDALCKHQNLSGKDGFVLEMPAHPCTWIKVNFPDVGETAAFRSSSLIPLDENGEPKPGWANRSQYHTIRAAPKKQVRTDDSSAVTVLGPRIRARAREKITCEDDYVNSDRNRSRSHTSSIRKRPKVTASPNYTASDLGFVPYTDMYATQSEVEIEPDYLSNGKFLSNLDIEEIPPEQQAPIRWLTEMAAGSEFSYVQAERDAQNIAPCILDSDLCRVKGLCSGCGKSLFIAAGLVPFDAIGNGLCWNQCCSLSPLNDFSEGRARPEFMCKTDGYYSKTTYSLCDAQGNIFAFSPTNPPPELSSAPTPLPVQVPVTTPQSVTSELTCPLVFSMPPFKKHNLGGEVPLIKSTHQVEEKKERSISDLSDISEQSSVHTSRPVDKNRLLRSVNLFLDTSTLVNTATLVSPLSSKDDNGSGFGSSSEIRLHAFSDAEVTIDSKTEEKHMQGSMHLQYMSHDEVEGEKNSSAYTCSLSPVNVPPAGSPRIVGAFCSVPSV